MTAHMMTVKTLRNKRLFGQINNNQFGKMSVINNKKWPEGYY